MTGMVMHCGVYIIRNILLASIPFNEFFKQMFLTFFRFSFFFFFSLLQCNLPSFHPTFLYTHYTLSSLHHPSLLYNEYFRWIISYFFGFLLYFQPFSFFITFQPSFQPSFTSLFPLYCPIRPDSSVMEPYYVTGMVMGSNTWIPQWILPLGGVQNDRHGHALWCIYN